MKGGCLFKAGLALAILVFGGAAAAADKPVTIPLSPYLGVIWSFEAEVGGKPETFLLDTAGGFTVITPQTAGKIGCTPWGRITGHRMRGDRIDVAQCNGLPFQAGGASFHPETVGVWDFANVLPKNAPPLAGSVALDAFAGRTVTLDLSRKQLIVETPASLKARIAAGREVEARLGRDAAGLAITPFVAVETPKGKLWLELDSGSDAPVVVGDHAAGLLGLTADPAKPQPLKARLAGGVALDTDTARVMPIIIDGNIGAPTLARWIVTLDLATGRTWIAPAT